MTKHEKLEEYRQSQDSENSIRKDPPKSSAVSSHAQFRKDNMGLINLDPKRHYVGVFARDEESVARYEGEGYVVETVRNDGPKYSGYSNANTGEPVVFRGHILMSIDRIELAANNARKQAQSDALQNKIRNKKEEDQRYDGTYGVAGVSVTQHEVSIPAPR